MPTKNPKLKEIADKSGLSISYLYRVLKTGERIPRVHTFKRIADALGVTMDTLYRRLKHFYEKEKR